MSLWVLGTDTGIGKTLVSALILHRYAAAGPIAYWKPVSTGGDEDRDRSTVIGWLGAPADPPVAVLDEIYLFDPPLSPHLAARLGGVSIDSEAILAELVRHATDDIDRNLIIEAAGGVLVPLTDDGVMYIDVVAASALPAVVVARSTLGTINHTLLTLEALRGRGVPIAGVVLNGPPNPENRRAIERFGHVDVLSEVPPLAAGNGSRAPSRAQLRRAAASFDPDGVLAIYLGGTSAS